MSNIAIGNAAAQEVWNQKSISWIISKTANTEYDWMCKQFERERATRDKIYFSTILAVVITVMCSLPFVVFGTDMTEGAYTDKTYSGTWVNAHVFRADDIIVWTYEDQRHEAPLESVGDIGDDMLVRIELNDDGSFKRVAHKDNPAEFYLSLWPMYIICAFIVGAPCYVRFVVLNKKCPMLSAYLKWANKVKEPTVESWLDYWEKKGM